MIPSSNNSSSSVTLLQHNYFFFHDSFYVQCCGASMGAKVSPSLANLYIGWWEECFLFSHLNLYAPHIYWYGHYIDDLILLWDHTDASLISFVSYLNNNSLNLEFSYVSNKTLIDFLDITLRGDFSTGLINTGTFRKPTSKNSLLLDSSYHPPHTIRSILVGEFIRAKRNCSTPESFQLHCSTISKRLSDRGYQKWHINRAISIAPGKDRNNLIYNKEKYPYSLKHTKHINQKNRDKSSLTFVTTFSREFNQIK